jgi:hypothetical protein
MTNEQINIAIAESCLNIRWYELQWCWYSEDLRKWVPCVGNSPLSDLNAMHEAEKVLTNEQWVAYGKELSRLKVFPMVHATAKQRAEAFLKTLGKWEE